MTRTARRAAARNTAASAAAAAALAVLITACSSGADAPDAELGFHAVLASYSPPLDNPDLTAQAGLEALGLEASDTATATMEWFIAGDCASPAPATNEFLGACDADGSLYLLKPAVVDQGDIASAEAPDEGGLYIEFTDHGTELFAELTAAVASADPPQNQVGILLNGEVLSAPGVQEEITSGAAHITSVDPDRDWGALAAQLNAARRAS
jgi:preprotein translocase subunit SecD